MFCSKVQHPVVSLCYSCLLESLFVCATYGCQKSLLMLLFFSCSLSSICTWTDSSPMHRFSTCLQLSLQSWLKCQHNPKKVQGAHSHIVPWIYRWSVPWRIKHFSNACCCLMIIEKRKQFSLNVLFLKRWFPTCGSGPQQQLYILWPRKLF